MCLFEWENNAFNWEQQQELKFVKGWDLNRNVAGNIFAMNSSYSMDEENLNTSQRVEEKQQ